MKTLISRSIAAFALILSAFPARAGPADSWEGVWRNTRNTVHVRASRCGQGMCGTVIWAVPKAQADARRGSGHALIGAQLFRDFRPSGNATWKGKAYLPDMDRTISGTITQTDPRTIEVSGCLLWGLACKKQHWHRME